MTFVVWQIAAIAFPALRLPDWAMTFVVVLALLGFPFALVLAWVFDATPDGLQRTDGATLAPAPTVTTTIANPKPVQDTSVVVLPFANLGADPENEYFSDGLTEELITDLSRIKALRVISRTSAMLLKGGGRSVQAVGQELGVRYVLEGSVRKAGSSLRITAQLIDAASDTQLWADKYTGTLDDVFDLQERVSREIVRALDVTLSADEDLMLAERPIDNVAVYDCYLRARHEMAQATDGSLTRAAALLRRGLASAGENSRLRATLAFTEILRMRVKGQMDAAVLDASATQARDVLRRDPNSAAAHFVVGTVEFERGRQREAAAGMRNALRLDPSDLDAATWLGIVYVYAGQIGDARAVFDRLRIRDPLSPFPLALASVVEWFDGDFAAGIEPMAKCMELGPEGTIWRWQWGYVLALNGRIAEAAVEAERMWQTDPAHPYSVQFMAMTRALRGEFAAAHETISRLDDAHTDAHMTFHVAECYALIGELDRAAELVERAMERGFYPYAFIARHDPFLIGLRATPRFEQIEHEAKRRWREFRHHRPAPAPDDRVAAAAYRDPSSSALT